MRDEIETSRIALGIASSHCALVAPHRHTEITLKIASEFTTLSYNSLRYYWWWEHFKVPNRSLHVKDPLKVVSEILRPDEKYWFLVEAEAQKKESPFWLYEMVGGCIPRIIAETHALEYYIVDRKISWLLCENHHNVLVGVGESIVQWLASKFPGDRSA